MLPRSLFAALFALAASAGAFAETKSVAVGPFTKIRASAGMDVRVTPGPHAAALEGDARHFDRVSVVVSGDTLVVTRKKQNWWGNGWGSQVLVRVQAPALTSLSASSGADLDVSDLNAQALSLDASSGASLRVNGVCTTLEAEASSGATIKAAKLECASANVAASSGADADVFAKTAFNAKASSGAGVEVRGGGAAGEVSQSSGGSVRQRS